MTITMNFFATARSFAIFARQEVQSQNRTSWIVN